MKFYFVISLLCLTSISPLTNGARVLGLFPFPAHSHFYFFQPLLLGLAEAGHDVTVVSHFPNKKPVANYTDLILDGMPSFLNTLEFKNIEDLQNFREIKFKNFFLINNLDLEAVEKAFQSNAIKEVLKSPKKFDVVLIENFANDGMHAIAHMLGAPVIGLASHPPIAWHYSRMGNPFISSIMPDFFLGHSTEMGFWQRLNNAFHHHSMNFLHEIFCQRETNKLIRKYFGDKIPPVQELIKKTSLMFINQHYSLSGPMPYVPGFVEIGGLHITKPKPLDPELKAVLDKAKKGAVYISWGSMVRPETLPQNKKEELIKALSQLDQLVILKWPNTSIPDAPKNFYVRDWMPQKDVLCHPNVKVFMTHSGLLGTTEGIHCGVAIVATPLFSDQFANAAAVEARHAGVTLPYRQLEEEKILKAVKTALSPSIQENVKIISEAFRNRPVPPLKLAIWWVENIAKTKGLQLAVNSSSRMHWFTYYNLDVQGFVLIVLVLVIIGIRRLMKKIFCSVKVSSGKTKEKSH